MNNGTFTQCYRNTNTHTYNILGDLKVHITVTENSFDLPLDALFSMAARINKKRAFLFVSKILGKHIPVNPYVSLLSGSALALLLHKELSGSSSDAELILEGLRDSSQAKSAYLRLQENKWTSPQPISFIGFAETATALGHSMFASFADGCHYVHTTRELIGDLSSSINFEEEHSHATAHRCYAEQPVRDSETVVLVDDEMTTGKTTLNIIRELHKKYPRNEYYVASLLDWRTSQDQERFCDVEKELGISIKTLSLVKGEIEVEGEPILEEQNVRTTAPANESCLEVFHLRDQFDHVFVSSSDTDGNFNHSPYLRCTGRFGLTSSENTVADSRIAAAAELLKSKRIGEKTLCLGTGEFMYIPMRIAAEMGDGVSYHSTTRSPIHPHEQPPYAIRDAHSFPNPDDPSVQNYFYNVTQHSYDDLFVFLERQVPPEHLAPLVDRLCNVGIKRVNLVYFHHDRTIPAPKPMGSYAPDDVVFLLKNLQHVPLEKTTEDREEAIQSGIHYSEMLPVEYQPSPDYLQLFHETLQHSAEKVALAAGTVAELIMMKRGAGVVLVSLARAGTPIGILIKRYLSQVHGISLPHYSISIIRGKGIDENALLYILQNHTDQHIQFIDGWTGKGAIRQVLMEACADFARTYGISLSDDLAVLADSGSCSETYGTREDFLIPSACLNSTVSGLVSRTVLRPDLIGPLDFHGAKFYEEWLQDDLSNLFVDTVAHHFPNISAQAKTNAQRHMDTSVATSWQGMKDIRKIQEHFGIADVNLVKPGVGETTRVLLRRVPWKILVDRMDNPNLQHILLLASDRKVPVEEFPGLTYSCCGLIKPLKGELE